MKVACPECGRSTQVDPDFGDFPIPCQRCKALVRLPRSETEQNLATPVFDRSQALAVARPEPGILSSLLTASTAAGQHSVLRPESRREIARAHARQEALHRAQLRGNHQALGFLSTLGFICAGLLAVGALAMQAKAIWFHH